MKWPVCALVWEPVYCTYTVVGWSELVLFANFETKISTILVVQFKKNLSLAALAFTCVLKFACSKNRMNINKT